MTVAAEPMANAERLWREWLDWAAGQGMAAPPSRDPAFEETRARVWEGSDFVATTVARYPETFAQILASGDLDRPYDPGEMGLGLAVALADLKPEGVDDQGLQRRLRLFRRREMLRLIWRDLGGAAALEETLEDLSELADVCVNQALDWTQAWTRAELGTPRNAQGEEQRLLVIGMGKLGARELNMSSDIDLILAYPETGQVDGPRPLTNEQFFIRLGQRLVRALDALTVDGFVFRVDTRLRPFGDAGPLAMSFTAMEYYYQDQAREWERYAMVKARVVAGPRDQAEQLAALLRPFVYRRYLDFGAIESIRDMKAMIAKELQRKGMADNIKLGPGGIREIEFIGQTFQLVRGGRDPQLQIRPIRPVLRLLGERGLLPADAVQQLDEAYVFLRRVENRLQAWKDQQTYRLPEDDLGRWRLARSLGFGGWADFLAALDEHRHQVQGQFDSLFAAPRAEQAHQEPAFTALWRGRLEAAQAEELLGQAGFAAPHSARLSLESFRETVHRKDLGSRGRERLGQLMPLALPMIAGSQAPDLALERVLRVLEAVARRTAYLAMLVERPIILSQLVRLTGMSPWIGQQIVRQPLLLDELIDTRRLYSPLRRVELEAELDALLDPLDPEDLEQQMERLRQFTQGNRLRVAAADLTGAIPLMVVSDYLTDIAEASLERIVSLTYRHLVQRHGAPAGVGAGGTGFLVVGYGKLGGIELGYGSDLDLVFLHGSDSVNAMTTGPKVLANDQFYARLGQRAIHMMTTQTPSGQLYEVDMRLRPDGNKGLLVRSLASFAHYQGQEAWTWEHQALVRARSLAGDRGLYDRFARIRRDILCMERDPDRLRQEVREMRAKMRASLDKSGGGRFDLKQGQGGIADIEFMVQYSILRWASHYPELADWSDNIRLLESLGRLDLLPGRAATALTAAYKDLRAAYHRSALQDEPTTVAAGVLLDSRERVAALWRVLMED
ncbi:MAG: bifunctional [glutamate--ammonia ligase]-adenylyl-L-tyrosine phosphorylase/[glutamate--ammonia-ligase] adenylyltransferase [Chromatiaceae bacterium]